ncbi:hypothetical protein HNR23_001373 [Nocardiopsis mwathae]|uniref:Uncharacterized protein n=1 Tax=Nocardiopsis mwathae TaxID=1472723 RepID=A0A7W9YFP1_9ACTN|nr:hypothetical protein [Nocardiopsis mwathae]MBB6171313.1 hypothetical protein [Nocardiopsis mwathae]
MQDTNPLDSVPVYQPPAASDRPRAFYVDCWDDDAEEFVHTYYGVTSPAGGGIARPLTGRDLFSFQDPELFADRRGGVLVWC